MCNTEIFKMCSFQTTFLYFSWVSTSKAHRRLCRATRAPGQSPQARSARDFQLAGLSAAYRSHSRAPQPLKPVNRKKFCPPPSPTGPLVCMWSNIIGTALPVSKAKFWLSHQIYRQIYGHKVAWRPYWEPRAIWCPNLSPEV